MNEDNFVYPDFRNDLQQARQLNEQMQQQPQVASTLIQLCKHMLDQISPETFPWFYAFIKAQLGRAFIFLPGEDHATNLKQAIALFQVALSIWTLKADPDMYANTYNDMGNAYSSLLTEDREFNLKRAITCYKEALRVWTPETDPDGYALVQICLGTTYIEMPTKEREANLNRAIGCFNEALRFVTAKKDLRGYILIQEYLGVAYTHLQVDRVNNLSRAIGYLQEALRLIMPVAHMMQRDYANIQLNLGVTYMQLTTGNIAKNVEHALTCFQASSHFWTPQTGIDEYLRLQSNLGAVYNLRLTGDRTANLTQAIACFQEVLRFWTPEMARLDYARAQMHLGHTYNNLPTKNRTDNLERAITCYEEALHCLSPGEMPLDYARAQTGLGNACCYLAANINLTGKNRAAKLKRAIPCYQAALRICSPQTMPVEYADVQSNLGGAYTEYSKLIVEDRIVNMERAIACYKEALRFRTPESAPAEYAATQNNMGLTYANASKFSTGEAHAVNVESAIVCYKEALRFRTPETDPLACRNTSFNLVALYFRQEDWQAALDASLLAISAGERLYLASFSSEGKSVELRDNAMFYQRAAFSAIQCGKVMEGLLLLEQGKTRLLIETLRLRIERPAGVPDKDWQTFEDAGTALRTAQTETSINTENIHYPSPMQGYQKHESAMQTYQEYEQKMHMLNMALDAAISRVRLYDPTFLNVLDPQDLQNVLSESQQALIAFCITEQGSIGIIMMNQGQQIEVVPIKTFTSANLNRLFAAQENDELSTISWLEAYQRFLHNHNHQAHNIWEETMTGTLEALGQSLLFPILSRLPASITQLTFLPSVQLFLFPLHAVPLSLHPMEYLCDRYQVSYAPSVEVLAMIKTRASHEVRTQEPGLYALINPAENASLPFAPSEGTAIGQFFAQPQLDRGPDGTKERVLAGMQTQTYIHFACHGSYDWNDPSFSSLLLAGEQRLTLADLQYHSINLSHTRLVTLSACETGITDVMRNSPAEYVGIPAGFLLAGVPCVIGSLWSVPDISTAMLMEHFYYQHLHNNMSIAAALRKAQQWVRHLEAETIANYATKWYRQTEQKDSNKQAIGKQMAYYRGLADDYPQKHLFEHPYYWAAFTVNGV